jgi:hypothetical protein
MAELNEVLIFCALYSGVILFSLSMTVRQKVAVRRQQKVKFKVVS